MATVIIPKELNKEKNLIAVPRTTYKEFLVWQRRTKSARTFKPTAAEKKALSRARKNLARGKYFTLAELEYEIHTAKKLINVFEIQRRTSSTY